MHTNPLRNFSHQQNDDEWTKFKFTRVCVMKKSWSTNPGARISHKGILGAQISYKYVFGVFSTKPGARCMYHEPKIIKNPGQIVICTIPQDIPSPRLFWKKGERGNKNNLVWSTNVPGGRISLENEFPGERILGKPPRKNCGEKNYGEKTPLENPNLFLCAKKVLARKPPWKIPICFYYVLDKFWWENPVGKQRQANLSNLLPPANSLGEASRHRNGLEAEIANSC